MMFGKISVAATLDVDTSIPEQKKYGLSEFGFDTSLLRETPFAGCKFLSLIPIGVAMHGLQTGMRLKAGNPSFQDRIWRYFRCSSFSSFNW